MKRPPLVRTESVVVAFCLSAPLSAQAFVSNTTDIPTSGPANGPWTENVDFADLDLDGDWDAIWAEGGDAGNDQNRIWINQGGLQAGTLGVFTDESTTRLPAFLDDSRDVELADIDGDGDLDNYTSNTSAISNQSNRWLINEGGLQGGTLGFFTDETLTRWVGLGGAGSSIAPSNVLVDGGFIDWSCDCDFGDLDNDGDLDLVHSTYGGSFGGSVPTRLFLNDGDGFFSEFNPSGFQLSSSTIANGNPALWAEGSQQANTSNSSGAQADIATSTLDVDVGDHDGDLDLDILHGDRNNVPRFFINRLEESGGVLGRFRDRSNALYPSSWSSGGGNYEQELGDIDNDGDLDLYGLNWAGFTDRIFRNNGGVFGNTTNLLGSNADDNEGDFFDYDNDGDLDLYVANFSGQDKLYRNDDTGSGSVTFTIISPAVSGLSVSGSRGIDMDACDVDGDGDYDAFVARDNGNTNLYLENQTGTPDTTGPSLYRLEQIASGPATQDPHVVRVQVYDNAPYYITWYNPTVLEVEVDGVALPPFPMQSSMGQIFRGLVPGNLVGSIDYRAVSEDEYGNSGSSATLAYTATGGPAGTDYGTGSNGSLGVPSLDALSLPWTDSTLYLAASNTPPGTGLFLALGVAQTPAPLDLSNGLILNVQLPIALLVPLVSDPLGDAVLPLYLPPSLDGLALHVQAFTLDGTGGDAFASSRGLRVQVTQ